MDAIVQHDSEVNTHLRKQALEMIQNYHIRDHICVTCLYGLDHYLPSVDFAVNGKLFGWEQ
jgi:hypothetical protein